MTTLYLDTNPLLSAFHSGDPYTKESRAIAESKTLSKYTSPLTVVELASVISRLYKARTLLIHEEATRAIRGLDFKSQVRVITDFILTLAGVVVVGMDSIGALSTDHVSTKAPIEFAEANRNAPVTLLKTLDNLQLAAARIMAAKGYAVDYFVTGDQDILKARKRVKEITALTVASPSEIASLEGLL